MCHMGRLPAHAGQLLRSLPAIFPVVYHSNQPRPALGESAGHAAMRPAMAQAVNAACTLAKYSAACCRPKPRTWRDEHPTLVTSQNDPSERTCRPRRAVSTGFARALTAGRDQAETGPSTRNQLDMAVLRLPGPDRADEAAWRASRLLAGGGQRARGPGSWVYQGQMIICT